MDLERLCFHLEQEKLPSVLVVRADFLLLFLFGVGRQTQAEVKVTTELIHFLWPPHKHILHITALVNLCWSSRDSQE